MRQSILAAALFIAGTALAIAQDKPVPPPRDFKPETAEPKRSLPALELPQYVITGEDVIRLTAREKEKPALARQEEFSAYAGLGTREAWSASPSRVRDPLALPPVDGIRRRFFALAGYGRFRSPLAEAWFGDRYERGDIAAHAAYEGSGEYVRRSDFRRFQLDASGGVFLPNDLLPILARSRVEGEVHVGSRDYSLFANRLVPRNPRIDFDRMETRIGYSAGLVSRRNAVLDYTFRASAEHTLLFEDLIAGDSLTLDRSHQYENSYGLAFQSRHHTGGGLVVLDASFHTDVNTPRGAENVNPVFLRLSAEAAHRFDEHWSARAGLRFHLYRGSGGPAGGRLYPLIEGRYAWTDEFDTYVSFEGDVERNTMRDLLDRNPYLVMGARLRHDDIPIRARIGSSYDNRRTASALLYVQYEYANRYARFIQLPEPFQQQWDIRSDGAVSIVALHGEGAFRIAARDVVHVQATIRSSQQKPDDGSIPYLPSADIAGMYTHRFPFPLELSAIVQFTGERATDGSPLPSYFLLGFQGEYRFTDALGAFFRLRNTLDQTYQMWPSYDGRPLFVLLGLTFRI